jgi:glycosyltransferase involved in cell wall biosynthesis
VQASSTWRLGTEHEKFVFRRSDLRRVPYEGPDGIAAVLREMRRFGWQPVIENGNTIALTNEARCSITLEPGGQFELSGAPLETLHQTCDELREHFRQVRKVCDGLGLIMHGAGAQHHIEAEAALFRHVAAAETRIPTIETLHSAHDFFDTYTWPTEQARSQQITGFVAVSELVRRQYLRANPQYPPKRVVTIPNGVDHQHISHRDRRQARAWFDLGDEFLFVSLARYTLQKNTFALVTAFGDVAWAYPEAHLLCAGGIIDPLYFEQVRRLRDGLHCAPRIHLRGPAQTYLRCWRQTRSSSILSLKAGRWLQPKRSSPDCLWSSERSAGRVSRWARTDAEVSWSVIL